MVHYITMILALLWTIMPIAEHHFDLGVLFRPTQNTATTCLITVSLVRTHQLYPNGILK